MADIKTDKQRQKEFLADMEKSVSEDGKRLRRSILRRGIIDRILGLVSPLAASGPAWGISLALLRVPQHILNATHDQIEWQARISIDQKIGARLTEEFITTMPEVERNVKTEGFLRGKINSCARSMANLISSKTRRDVCFVGGLASIGLSLIKGSWMNALLVGGAVGVPIVATQMIAGVVEMIKGRGADKHEDKMYRPIWEKTSSLLRDPALQKSTGSAKENVEELNQMISDQNAVKSIWNKELLRIGAVPIVTADIFSALAMGASWLITNDWHNAVAAYAASNGLASSIGGFLGARRNVQRLSKDIFSRYEEAKHDKIYNLQYGDEKMSSNVDTICLDHIGYKFRNNSDQKINRGKKNVGTAFTSHDTIFIEPGITILGGVSGAGKTTFYSLLRHADDVDEGTIAYGHKEGDNFSGKKITDFAPEEIPSKIGFSLQSVSVSDDKTVFDVIRMQNPGLSDEEIERFAGFLGLKLYNVTDSGEKTPKKYAGNNTSGGEKKRILFLQALLSGKRFLVFDEPTSGVDDPTRDKMIQLLNAVGRTKKVTIMYTTHNSEEIALLDAQAAVDLEAHQSSGKNDREPSVILGYEFKDAEEKMAYMDVVKHRNAPTTEKTEEKEEAPAINWDTVGQEILATAEEATRRERAAKPKENKFLKEKAAIEVDVVKSTIKNSKAEHMGVILADSRRVTKRVKGRLREKMVALSKRTPWSKGRE